jgi:hypothetical protein
MILHAMTWPQVGGKIAINGTLTGLQKQKFVLSKKKKKVKVCKNHIA